MIKFLFNSFIILVIGLIAGCGHGNTDKICTNDFEQTTAWADAPSVIFGNGHSGYYYSYTVSTTPYSATFKRNISELEDHPIKAVEISSWVRPMEAGANGGLVLSVARDGKEIIYYSIDSKTYKTETGSWTQINGKTPLPPDLKRDDILKVYVWNNSKKRLDVDDFEIHFKY